MVWTTTPREADQLVKMSDGDFAAEVNAALRGEGRYAFSAERPDGGGGGTFGGEGVGALLGGSVVAFQEKLVSRVLRPATEAAIAATAGLAADGGRDGRSGGDRGGGGGGGGSGFDLIRGPAFETPPEVTAARGTRGAFPLATQHAGRYALRRLALVGDAAHQVHPLGGQGVNLGIRDARLLVDALAAAAATGADVGSVTALDGYSRSAAAANLPMMAALDGLQKLFAAEAPLVAWARGAGLAGVNALGPVRRLIAKYAMGGA